MRITDATAPVAQAALKSGEKVELKDRHGVVHRGRVRGVEYQLGIDQGWMLAFEMDSDGTVGPVFSFLSKGAPKDTTKG